MSLKFFSLIFVSFWSWFLSRRWKCLIPRATFLWPMARQELCEGGCPPVNYIFDVKITDFRGGRFYNATITRQITQRNKNFTLGLNGIKNSYDWKILVPKNLTDRKSKKKKYWNQTANGMFVIWNGQLKFSSSPTKESGTSNFRQNFETKYF